MWKRKVTQGKKGTNSELSNQKKCTPSQLETKDEDVVLGEQSVIISKKTFTLKWKASSRPTRWDKGFYFQTEIYVANVQQTRIPSLCGTNSD